MLLVFLSVLVAGVMAEICLRVFFPRYQYAAESQYNLDAFRIWSRKANARSMRSHPDTGVTHPIIYNNLAMRQHRQITRADLESAVNIGFFGDSYTEDIRLAAQYSFTEPLDYLLNTSGRRFNVLNFGVDGYGTDQSYLYYKYSPYAKSLDYVFYVMCGNDIRDIYENKLFSLSETGALVRSHRPETPWWLQFASRLYLTYFILDVRLRLITPEETSFRRALEQKYVEAHIRSERDKRLHSKRGVAIERDMYKRIRRRQEDPELQRVIAIFGQILEQWRQDVEANGARFYVVLLPDGRANTLRKIVDPDFALIDLHKLFQSAIPDYHYKQVRFANDPHWNELGNLIAAVQLYRVLEQAAHLPVMSANQLKRHLYTYYSAFPNAWMPPSTWVLPTDIPVASLSRIRNKYLELELNRQEEQPKKMSRSGTVEIPFR
jgi:hypothetical protein